MDLRITVEDLVEASGARARAEAIEWAAMLGFRDAELARIVRVERPMQRLVETAGIAREIALAMGLSEGQVVQRLAAADRLTEHAPHTWNSFLSGGIDASRAKEIALTLGRLERAESRTRLDETVVPYAETHTVGELRGWGRRARWRSPDQRLRRCRAPRGRTSLASLGSWCGAGRRHGVAQRLPAVAPCRGHREAAAPRGEGPGR